MEKSKDDSTSASAPVIRSSQLSQSAHIYLSSAGSVWSSQQTASKVQKLETAAATITFTTGDDDDDDSEDSEPESEADSKKGPLVCSSSHSNDQNEDSSAIDNQRTVFDSFKQKEEVTNNGYDEGSQRRRYSPDNAVQNSEALCQSSGTMIGCAEAPALGSQDTLEIKVGNADSDRYEKDCPGVHKVNDRVDGKGATCKRDYMEQTNENFHVEAVEQISHSPVDNLIPGNSENEGSFSGNRDRHGYEKDNSDNCLDIQSSHNPVSEGTAIGDKTSQDAENLVPVIVNKSDLDLVTCDTGEQSELTHDIDTVETVIVDTAHRLSSMTGSKTDDEFLGNDDTVVIRNSEASEKVTQAKNNHHTEPTASDTVTHMTSDSMTSDSHDPGLTPPDNLQTHQLTQTNDSIDLPSEVMPRTSFETTVSHLTHSIDGGQQMVDQQPQGSGHFPGGHAPPVPEKELVDRSLVDDNSTGQQPSSVNVTEEKGERDMLKNSSVNFDEQWGPVPVCHLPSFSPGDDSAYSAVGEDPDIVVQKLRTDSTEFEYGVLESGLPSSHRTLSYSAETDSDTGTQAQNYSTNSPRLRSSHVSPDISVLQERDMNGTAADIEASDVKGSNTSKTVLDRFNPFDREFVVDENHFENDEDEIERRYALYERERVNSSFTSDLSGPQWQEDSGDDISFAQLGLSEDHFSQPEGHFGLSTLEELELAIDQVKEMVKKTQSEEKKKNLIKKLIHLRLKLSEAKETPDEAPDVKTVLGHIFKHKTQTSSKTDYCEKCNGVIWGLMQSRYKCTGCGYQCHEKCINLILRHCAKQKVIDNPVYQLNICPEKGLSAQNYRCAECRVQISYSNKSSRGQSEPRQCDYSGLFYCALCHWNDSVIMPARVLHNWDFEPKKVCRASKQYLRLMLKKAVLRIQDINPMLFSFVEELNEVKKLREEILIMKKYFLACEDALKSRLLLQLQDRQHFVENSDMYSVQDLMDIADDKLLPQLAKIHTSFAQHIKTDCQRCKVKGYICEICNDDEVLFPFDNIATVCGSCSTVLHRHCLQRKNNQCPKCVRLSRRAVDSSLLEQSM